MVQCMSSLSTAMLLVISVHDDVVTVYVDTLLTLSVIAHQQLTVTSTKRLRNKHLPDTDNSHHVL